MCIRNWKPVQASSDEYPVILTHSCLCSKQCTWFRQGLHQLAGPSAGPALLFQPGAVVQPSGFHKKTWCWVITDNCSEIPGSKKRKFWRAKWLQEISSDICSSEFIFGRPDKRERKANELFGLHKKGDTGQLTSSWWRQQHDCQWPGEASCPFSATSVATNTRAVSLLQLAV